MYVERLLQINVATLAALATLLVGMGQHSPILPLGMMAAAMLSVWLTDFTGRFALGRTVTALASIGAVAVSLPWSMRWDKIALVVAVADFLVYVQAIHLFQRKTPRIYWALIRFSVLQVVVAALLVQGALFGMLLVVYLFTALGALALLLLHCERLRYPGAAGLRPARSGLRWPLAGQLAEFSSAAPGRVGVQRELFRRLLRIGAATLVLSVPVFFIVPRIGQSAWHGVGVRPLHAVGFSDQVVLGHLGTVLENPEQVLQLRLYDDASNEPYRAREEIYLRGAVLTAYDDGQWSKRLSQPQSVANFFALPDIGRPRVRQRIRIEPMYREDLFCVWPFAPVDPDHADRRLDFDRQTGRLSRRSEHKQERFEFELSTTAFANREQSPLYPNVEFPLDYLHAQELLKMPRKDGRNPLPGLVDLASRWLAGVPIAAENRYGRARYLEGRLRDSGDFTYSLEGQSRDPGIDPIEDFIAKNRRGHCEYFATALTLMLRSQGTPARMVIGYRTGEWNNLGGFFQVRQLHAHTWVEAYLRRGDLPAATVQNGPWSNGGWLRLDPTPASDPTQGAGPWTHGLTRAIVWLDFLWSHYVLDMDRPRQREAIYNPVLEALKQAAVSLTSPAWWNERLADLWRALGLDRSKEEEAAEILGPLAVSALAAVLILLSGYFMYRVALVRVVGLRLGRPRRAGRRAGARVEFYRRFEVLLARRGLVRPPSQTQREFAVRAGRELAQRAGDQRMALLPVQVAEAFYRVRFGGAALDTPQREAVEQALAQLKDSARRKTA